MYLIPEMSSTLPVENQENICAEVKKFVANMLLSPATMGVNMK